MATGADTAATFAATLVDEWARCRVSDAVVAPGSRSTPLVAALAADARIRVHVHHDERSAAYVALGLGLASGWPALVVTTSGTAAVELHPAVVEAHQARVPMLACTADRPAELRDVGAPQAIDQTHLFGGAVRWFADPGVPDAAAAGTWRSLAARAVAEAVSSPPGPVHLNLPFREPLLGTPGDLPPGRPGEAPWHWSRAAAEPDPTLLDELAGQLRGRRVVLIAGRGAGAPDAVERLARAGRWPVFADARAGVASPDVAVRAFDSLLRVPKLSEAARPEVVVRLGEPPASRVCAEWLAGLDARDVLVHPDGAWLDPSRTAEIVVAADGTAVCDGLAGLVSGAEGPDGDKWLATWIDAEQAAQRAIDTTLARHPEVTEPLVARTLLRQLPEGASLVVASSMPIRDVEWYGAARAGIRVLANRGANGIDGVVSTAVGAALESGGPTAVLVGDLALLHDTNGLLGAASRQIDLAVVVVDNRGGGIFSFLPQARVLPAESFERFFGTPHDVDLAALAGAHGVPAQVVEDAGSLAPALDAAFGQGSVRMVVTPTDRAANVTVHNELNAAVASSVS